LIPGYQWKVNGSNAGTNSPSFTYSPANGDQVSCTLNSSASCITGNPALSNIITMTVNTNLPAGVSISTPTNPFCPGTAVTITATPTNGGPTPVYQWKVNAINVINANNASYAYNAVNGDVVTCELTSNLNCVTGNPAISNSILLSERAAPNVTFTSCFDTVTILGAQPFSLHGGLPLGGQYSGPGVNTGIFTPSVAGTGLKTITYGYSNVYTCLATKTRTILVQPNPAFSCGNNLTDIRDNKVYPTVQIGSQCWMAANLDFGFQISDLTPQTDNCIAEKYLRNSIFSVQYSIFYQWDELMRYTTAEGAQGLCPPGWHVPSAAEWNTLLAFYSGPGVAGGPMKDTLLLNGFKSYQQGFLYQNNTWAFTSGPAAGAIYWSSTASGGDRAVARGFNDYNPSVSMYPSARANAFPIRCLKD
ncbi:MAG: FISUMP domain-containing protein, partial [Bacteroidota bacterium]